MTSRRNLFKLAACAIAASAMEVFGLKETKTAEDAFEPWNYTGEVRWINVGSDRFPNAKAAAWYPQVMKYGYTVRHRRLP